MAEQHIPWLEPDDPFPHPSQALGDDSPWPGLLAAGGKLTAASLQRAYANGIFPWFSHDDPILWWSTHPRMVLQPLAFKLHKSLRKTLQAFAANPAAEIRIDTQFEQVMHACAAPRTGQAGTWITPAIVQAYGELHQQGLAHSVETWIDNQLVGGLYCVALGHAVFGESMFTRVPNASKIALSALVAICRLHHVAMIDCQQETQHLASLGASPIPRNDFLASIQQAQQLGAMDWRWQPTHWQIIF